jgi:hypothetical protein
VNGTGTIACHVSGSITFVPPLSAHGPAVATMVTLHAHLTSCSGTGDGARVVSGTATVAGQSPTNDCVTVLTTPPSGPRSGPLKWTVPLGTPRLAPSTIQLTSAAPSTGPPITLDTTGSATAGSFNGDLAAGHTVIRQTYSNIVAACTGTIGLKSLSFTTGSTFALALPSA